ncbi:hypothetical protein E2C01_099797 [Portunus trituberculatus]|uniref:Uncharacterized protein n=1 Tax=Portunus trituberculatus TaxID=210409 RepID=A0A5B7KHR3_PORTR|nr:hypothetical protein [Portunus trituberculatus]
MPPRRCIKTSTTWDAPAISSSGYEIALANYLMTVLQSWHGDWRNIYTLFLTSNHKCRCEERIVRRRNVWKIALEW